MVIKIKWETDVTKHIQKEQGIKELPKLSSNLWEWATNIRTTIGGEPRNFDYELFWEEIYKDESTQILLSNSRQSWKSTFGTDVIGCYVTSKKCEAMYIVDIANRLSTWSKQRFRKDTLQDNEVLRQFLTHDSAGIENVYLSNGSAVYCRLDNNQYYSAQGMSPAVFVFDESQFQKLEFRQYALESGQVKGERFYYLGVGGEQGSEWHNMIIDSKQYEWVWDIQGDYDYFDETIENGKIVQTPRIWKGMGVRNLLKFDDKGNLINTPDEINTIRKGKWVAKNPNGQYPSYNITRPMMLRLPLTISDAIYKYKRPKEMSVQYSHLTMSKRELATQVYGQFVLSPRIPITQAMVQKCYDRTKSFLTGKQVTELKEKHKDEVYVFLGIDWGSGKSNRSSTVGTITIYWKNIKQFQIAHVDIDPETNSKGDQAFYFVELFKDYNCDFCVADLGHGDLQVEYMQDGGFSSTGKQYSGLGRAKVRGCRTTGGIEKPDEDFKQESDEHGKKIDHITTYKTTIIEQYIDLFESVSMNVTDKSITTLHHKLLIPTKDDSSIINEILKQSCAINRVDIDPSLDQLGDDTRQSSEKKYGHPADVPMSIMYNILAEKHYDPNPFFIHNIRKTRINNSNRRYRR